MALLANDLPKRLHGVELLLNGIMLTLELVIVLVSTPLLNSFDLFIDLQNLRCKMLPFHLSTILDFLDLRPDPLQLGFIQYVKALARVV